MSRSILIAGGSGLIGAAIIQQARLEGWHVFILSRSKEKDYIEWDPQQGSIDISNPLQFDAIINLAGTSIAGKRWTKKQKAKIISSRTQSAATIEKYIRNGLLLTDLYIGASAIGIYSDHQSEPVIEDTVIHPSKTWIVYAVQEWESAHKRIESTGTPVIMIRIGLVLSMKGGALKPILQTANFGMLTYFGSGDQIWPWIHIDDLVRVFFHFIGKEKTKGIYLAVAPHPVSNRVLTHALNKLFRIPRLVLPVPQIALSLALGEMHNMVMQSCDATPARLLKEGFQFQYNFIEEAVERLRTKDQ